MRRRGVPIQNRARDVYRRVLIVFMTRLPQNSKYIRSEGNENANGCRTDSDILGQLEDKIDNLL